MVNPVTQRLYDHIKRLMRRQAYPHVKKILAKSHPADIASVFRLFDEKVMLKIFQLIESAEGKAEVISCLDPDLLEKVFNSMELKDLVVVLEEVPSDDLADILASIPEEMKNRILEGMKKEEKAEVVGLMHYAENTAGGLMNIDFLAMDENLTAKEAIAQLQSQHEDVEMAFYIYVISERKKLVGVLSLRQVVTSKPDMRLKEVMDPSVVSVTTHDDQEEVAQIISRYDFLAVPVVDDEGILVGVVTVDDIIDVMREEATEDMLKMAGAGERMVDAMSFGGAFKHRMPWLLLSWVGGALTALIIAYFDSTMKAILPLAAFIPMITGMSGNVGTQSATIVVRALATGRAGLDQVGKVLGREVAIGLLLGFVYGAALGVFGFVKYYDVVTMNALMLGLVISISLCVGMTLAAFVATGIPFLLHRFNMDPAAATGPFVTTFIDIIGIAVYLTLATFMLL